MFYFVFNVAKLPAKVSRVEEGTVIEAVVIGRVRLGKVRRRHNGHLVTIDRIAHKKVLHFVRNLNEKKTHTHTPNIFKHYFKHYK